MASGEESVVMQSYGGKYLVTDSIHSARETAHAVHVMVMVNRARADEARSKCCG